MHRTYQKAFIRAAAAACFTACLTACAGESPTGTAETLPDIAPPTHLFAVGDGSFRILSETMQGATLVSEYEVGAALLGDEYQGFVYIRVSVPQVVGTGSSAPCITSTIIRTEVRPGWTAAVKKAGGCDKPIQVDFTSAARQRATCKWTYIFGLTKVDHGAVR
jgi:hypothetical protein